MVEPQRIWPIDKEVGDLRDRSVRLIESHGEVIPANLRGYVLDIMSKVPVLGRLVRIPNEDKRLAVRRWVEDGVEVIVASPIDRELNNDSSRVDIITKVFHQLGDFRVSMASQRTLSIRGRIVEGVTDTFQDFDTDYYHSRGATREDVFRAHRELDLLSSRLPGNITPIIA